MAQNSFLENRKIGNLIRIYEQIILDEKQKASYLHRMTSKEFGFLHESYVTAVAMTTMTFQNSGYFEFRAILLENELGDPNFLFHKTLSLCIENYLGEFKKIPLSEKKIIRDNHVYIILNISTRENFFKLAQIISYTNRKSFMK